MKDISHLLSGAWTYRSFHNNADINADVSKLLFGMGTLHIEEVSLTSLKGFFDFGEGYRVNVEGSIYFGNPVELKFRGTGVANTPTFDWIYDYNGYLSPRWLYGIDQSTAVTGTVIRAAPHSNGQAKAGYVVSFIMVKQ